MKGVSIGYFRQVKLLNKMMKKTSVRLKNMILYLGLREILENASVYGRENKCA